MSTLQPSTSPRSTRQARSFSAPARVNLIGEHTDYTGGLVLPMAVSFATEATLTPADDGYRLKSEHFAGERVMTQEDAANAIGDWSDYPVGVLRQLQALGHRPAPFQILFRGDVPLGSGLSSSASIEVATAYALLDHLDVSMTPEDIAKLCQRAENQYVGSPCGIMDQTVSVLAQAGHALLLNTRDLTYELLPMQGGAMAAVSVVVCNSAVKHSVAAGEYGQRRKELEQGQAVLLAAHPQLRDLGDTSVEQLEGVRDKMSAESYKRCRHIVTENSRVREMREALLAGDPVRAGQLMISAHASERDDFECSCEEVDFLVDTAVKLPGCFGARLTGGGFGGCTVNLVAHEQIEVFQSALLKAYEDRFGIKGDVYVCEPVDGAARRNVLRSNDTKGELPT